MQSHSLKNEDTYELKCPAKEFSPKFLKQNFNVPLQRNIHSKYSAGCRPAEVSLPGNSHGAKCPHFNIRTSSQATCRLLTRCHSRTRLHQLTVNAHSSACIKRHYLQVKTSSFPAMSTKTQYKPSPDDGKSLFMSCLRAHSLLAYTRLPWVLEVLSARRTAKAGDGVKLFQNSLRHA